MDDSGHLNSFLDFTQENFRKHKAEIKKKIRTEKGKTMAETIVFITLRLIRSL